MEHEEAAGRRLGILTIPTRTARADRRWIWSSDFQELVKETMRRRLTVLKLSEEDITHTPGMDGERLTVRDLVGLYGLSRRGRRSRWRSRAGVGRRAPEGGRVPTLMPEADDGGRFETEGGPHWTHWPCRPRTGAESAIEGVRHQLSTVRRALTAIVRCAEHGVYAAVAVAIQMTGGDGTARRGPRGELEETPKARARRMAFIQESRERAQGRTRARGRSAALKAQAAALAACG